MLLRVLQVAHWASDMWHVGHRWMQMAKFFVLGRADVLGALLERPGMHLNRGGKCPTLLHSLGSPRLKIVY